MNKKNKAKLAVLTLVFLGDIAMAKVSKLKECPSSPNCVSTQTIQVEKKMEPIKFTQQSSQIIDIIKKVMNEQPRTKFIKEDENHLLFTSTSFIFRFTDDIEFFINNDNKSIEFRSASQTGTSDLGVNRKRMIELSKLISKELATKK